MLPKRFGRKKDNYAVYIIGYHRLYPKKFQFPCDNTIHQAKIQTFVKPITLQDICMAAGWASPSTFKRFYNLEVPALQSKLLLV